VEGKVRDKIDKKDLEEIESKDVIKYIRTNDGGGGAGSGQQD
jgi:hypothetical protein